MEERQPQDLTASPETTEPIPEEVAVPDEEPAKAEAETSEPDEESFREQEPTPDELVEEDLAEEEPTEEESFTEELPEEAAVPEETTEETNKEEPITEEPKPQLEDAPAKRVSAGLVIKPWQLAVAAGVVLAMLAGSVALGVALGNRNQSTFNDSPVDYEWVLPQGGSTNEDQIVLPGYDKLIFPAGEKQIEIVLPNPTGNPCYFRYTLVLEETGEILYQSKLIPPGKAVLQIELSRPLPVGDYTLLIGIDSISLADGRTPMNGGEGRALLQVR